MKVALEYSGPTSHDERRFLGDFRAPTEEEEREVSELTQREREGSLALYVCLFRSLSSVSSPECPEPLDNSAHWPIRILCSVVSPVISQFTLAHSGSYFIAVPSVISQGILSLFRSCVQWVLRLATHSATHTVSFRILRMVVSSIISIIFNPIFSLDTNA
jgi:hypothetical protein